MENNFTDINIINLQICRCFSRTWRFITVFSTDEHWALP